MAQKRWSLWGMLGSAVKWIAKGAVATFKWAWKHPVAGIAIGVSAVGLGLILRAMDCLPAATVASVFGWTLLGWSIGGAFAGTSKLAMLRTANEVVRFSQNPAWYTVSKLFQ